LRRLHLGPLVVLPQRHKAREPAMQPGCHLGKQLMGHGCWLELADAALTRPNPDADGTRQQAPLNEG
jgi:hypothetical protein